MNKIDLVRAIANNAGLTLKDAGNALDGFIAAVTEELKKGEKIQISGFSPVQRRGTDFYNYSFFLSKIKFFLAHAAPLYATVYRQLSM